MLLEQILMFIKTRSDIVPGQKYVNILYYG